MDNQSHSSCNNLPHRKIKSYSLGGYLGALFCSSFFLDGEAFGAGSRPLSSDGENSEEPQVIYKVYVAPTRTKPIQVYGLGDVQSGADVGSSGKQEIQVDSGKLSDILMNQLAATGRFKILDMKTDFPDYPGLLVIEPELDYMQLNAISGGVKAGTAKGLASKLMGVGASAGVSFKASEIGMDFKIRNCGELGSLSKDLSSCMLQRSIHISSRGWSEDVKFDLSVEEIAELSANFQKNTSVQKAFVQLFQKGAEKLFAIPVFQDTWEARVTAVNEKQTRIQFSAGALDGIKVGDSFEVIQNNTGENAFCSFNMVSRSSQNLDPGARTPEQVALSQCSSLPLAKVQVLSTGLRSSLAKIDHFLGADGDFVDENRGGSIHSSDIVRLLPVKKKQRTSFFSRTKSGG